jgi:putative ABC transport system ATP-binding protein/macrolide transport system ATP-binding/permease protein/lipoprotein-releasing system ATP-binding protein
MLVEVRDLHKTYTTPRGRIAAVAGLDLDVPAGEFLAVCGRSGSGKSTLLALLGGLCRPTAGSVRISGTDLRVLGARALAEFRAQHFGFLFQFTGLLPSLRAIDNIALSALLGAAGHDPAYRRARDLLNQVGLGNRWDAYPGELSGGEQRRVALARALINRPVLLLADEPTNDLDDQAEQEVLDLLRQLPKIHQTTLMVVTHDWDLARQADRVITLRSGKLIDAVRPEPVAVPGPQAVGATLLAPLPMPAETEPALAALTPAEPTPLGAGLGSFLIGFVGWAVLIVCVLWGIDYATARFQRQALVAKQAARKKSEELALQQLRADIEDVSYRPDGGYDVSLYLQNFQPHKPFYVLGPAVRVSVQVNRNWQEVPTSPADFADDTVKEVTGKRVFRFTFRSDLLRYDEVLKGYLHVRITNVMIVSEHAEPAEDLFQRTDDYYVYLKPQTVTEDAIRQGNGWSPKALVPRWIGMPAH